MSPKTEICWTCGGSGSLGGNSCPTCKGAGVTYWMQIDWPPKRAAPKICPEDWLDDGDDDE